MSFYDRLEDIEAAYDAEIGNLNDEITDLENDLYTLENKNNDLEDEVYELKGKLEVAGNLIKAMEAAFKTLSDHDIGEALDVSCAVCAHDQECSKMWKASRTSRCINSPNEGDCCEWEFDLEKWSA